jgi:hypothetical protein
MQAELLARGVANRRSRPYHPQTCGKVERFHQTLKRFPAAQPKARSIRELQARIDRFVASTTRSDPTGDRAAGSEGRVRGSGPGEANGTPDRSRRRGEGAPRRHRQGG